MQEPIQSQSFRPPSLGFVSSCTSPPSASRVTRGSPRSVRSSCLSYDEKQICTIKNLMYLASWQRVKKWSWDQHSPLIIYSNQSIAHVAASVHFGMNVVEIR